MNPKISALLVALAVGLSFSVSAAPLPNQVFDDYLSQLVAPSFPGVSVAVSYQGATVFAKGYGSANLQTGATLDEHTRFELASVTKQFTAMAVMILKEKGLLQYDSPVTNFFPEFSSFASKVTIRNLLQHTAGFPDYMELCQQGRTIKNSDVVALMAQKAVLVSPPGEKYEYSNTGYSLLGALIERAAGISYPDFLQQNILKPLKMEDSFVNIWGIPPVPNLARAYSPALTPTETPDIVNCNTVFGDGSLFSSAHDMALWNEALERNQVIGTQTSMDEAYRPLQLNSGTSLLYGFGWQLEPLQGLKTYSHGGAWAGFRNLNARFPEKQFSLVLLMNREHFSAGEILNHALEAYLGVH